MWAKQQEAARRLLEEAGSTLDDTEFDTWIVESDAVAEAIIEASSAHDLTVIGATREGLLQQFVFGCVPETVGREADGTVIMSKRYVGITSRLRHLVSQS